MFAQTSAPAYLPYVAIPIAAVGAWLVWNFRRGAQKRQGHARELKEKVLQPLRQQLDGFYRGLVTTRQPAVEYVEPAQPGGHAILRPVTPPELEDARLWPDARQHHFPELLQEFEGFKRDFLRLTADLADWIPVLAADLHQVSGLPEGDPTQTSAPCLNSIRLAHYIYRRHHGMADADLVATPEGALQAGSELFGRGTEAQARACRDEVEHLLRSRLPDSLAFRERFTKLQVQQDRMLYHAAVHMNRLRVDGPCGLA